MNSLSAFKWLYGDFNKVTKWLYGGFMVGVIKQWRVKLFPNLTRISSDYQLLSWETNELGSQS